MTEPVVSIITPVYNAERFVSHTIDSVLAQTFTPWELILINDRSTDRSPEIIQAYAEKDPRIHVLHMEHNSGAAVARNKGIDTAKGRYIAFLDADDIWLPEKLTKQIAFMQEKQCALSFTAYFVMQESGADAGRVIHCPKQISYHKLLIENRIGCLTAVIDTHLTGKMHMPPIRKRQDYGLWLNILKKGFTGYGLQEPLAKYRKYATSLSGNKLQAIRYNWTLLHEHQQLSLVTSAFYFMLFLANKGVMGVYRKLVK